MALQELLNINIKQLYSKNKFITITYVFPKHVHTNSKVYFFTQKKTDSNARFKIF